MAFAGQLAAAAVAEPAHAYSGSSLAALPQGAHNSFVAAVAVGSLGMDLAAGVSTHVERGIRGVVVVAGAGGDELANADAAVGSEEGEGMRTTSRRRWRER